MVDREARDEAAELVRQFISGKTFNFDFEDAVPVSADPAIHAIWDSLWPFYCDFRKHKMKNEWAIAPELKHQMARWVLFLHTDEEYLWPKISYPGIRPKHIGPLARLLGLDRKQNIFLQSGKHAVWPFISEESFINAKKHPKLMMGSSC